MQRAAGVLRRTANNPESCNTSISADHKVEAFEAPPALSASPVLPTSFGEGPLRRALQQYVARYHEERNHQGKQNRLLFPLPKQGASGENGIVRCKERLGGLLKYYAREAA
jgi:hypothetical protein